MALAPGTRLGPYEVAVQIGVGGMGEVYRATDTTLGRQVAIKVLPESVAADADRIARFEREARTLASLNHPNIAQIYGFEKSSGVHALVMELVEGPTLADRLAHGSGLTAQSSGPKAQGAQGSGLTAQGKTSGAIPLDEALPIAKQIAEALEAAHEQGIIHRDLKPANIKVRGDGTVKVLDFGLAKLSDVGRVLLSGPAGSKEHDPAYALSQSPTMTSPALMTGAGMILGTAAYMSPEQARGKAVDKRTDIWAFGCVLYEMLTARRPFEDEDVSLTLSKVLQREPDFDALPAAVPARVRQTIRLCLRKPLRERMPDIGAVRLALEGAFETAAPAAATLAAPSSPRGTRLAWLVAAVAVLGAAGLAVPAARYLREAPPAALPETRTDIMTPATGDLFSFALSPDGRQIVFVASGDGSPRLWLRPLSVTTAQPLAGTEGATYPFWSPDSRSIAFFSGGKLKRIDIGGGLPRTLANADLGRGGTWNPDGIILFQPSNNSGSGLFRVPASGGEAVGLGKPASRQFDHRFPHFLPGGRQFLFYARGVEDVRGIYLGSLDSAETKRLTVADSTGAYAPPGWLLFVRQGTLFEQRFDVTRGELGGDPIVIADQVSDDATGFPPGFSVSSEGLIAYRTGGADTGRQLTWFDRSGKVLGVAAPPDVSTMTAPELSLDGSRVAIDRTVEGNRDAWLMDMTRGSLVRFTFDPAPDGFPVWSPDGSRIAFESQRKGSWDIWLKAASGVGMEELLLSTADDEWPLGWSKDGRFLLYYQDGGAKTRGDLWALPMTGTDRKPIAVAHTPFAERTGEVSPDGRWVAYETDESGRYEIVVQPFPNPTGKWQVSTDGGVKPRWRADSEELYYLAPDSRLMAAAIAAQDATLRAGAPMALFPTRVATSGASAVKHQYAVSRDGRFLVNQTTGQAAVVPITLLLNWQPEARK